jgi:hypothetical protein
MGDISGVAELFHVVRVVPVEMGKDTDFDLVGVDASLAEFVRAVEAILFLAGVVILGRPLGVGQARIDHELVLAGVHIEAEYRDLDLFAGLALEKHVGTKVGLAPTGVYGIDLCFLH